MRILSNVHSVLRCLLLCVLVSSARIASGAQTPQHSEDASYKLARAQSSPEERIRRLQDFLTDYPSSAHKSTAQNLLLDTYLTDFPDRTSAIHALVQAVVASAPAGLERWIEEAQTASQLASAGPGGVDLTDAQQLANDALSHLSEASYAREVSAAQARYHLPRLPAKQVHAEFLRYKASFLAATAAVELKLHQLPPAAAAIGEAFKLQPLSGQVNALKAELALAQGDLPAALNSLERADVLGTLSPSSKAQERQLFHTLQRGDESALEHDLDAVYRALYPTPFSLPHRQLAADGHTALLELFTGSGCQPCAGPDLAIDSLLGSYSRQDLVVLAWDEPIPLPDPLTNPDAMDHAAAYGVGETPLAFLDGQPLQVLGASRQDTENIVIGFADQIEDQAARPSGVHLALSIEGGDGGNILVHPTLTVAPLPPDQVDVSTGVTTRRRLSSDVLYVALVQDNVHYSGENGVRLHRMVVRALAQMPTPAYLTGAATPPVTFSPAELDTKQRAFLDAYEQKNDRFGPFRFRTKNLPLAGGDLAVAAWIQDPSTHQILQSTFAAVPAR